MSDQNPPADETPEESAAAPPSPYGSEPPPVPPTYQPAAQPPPPGYGVPNPYAATGPAYSPTDAVGWGWTKFKANVGPLIITGIILFAVQIVFGILESTAGRSDSGGMFQQYNALGYLLQVASFVVSLMIGAGIVRAALGVADGGAFDIAKVFSADKLGAVVVAALITGLLSVIGIVLCILPGLAVIFFSQYVNYFIVDQGQGPIDAIKSSFSFVGKNFGPTLLFALLSIAVVIAGAIACGVGLIVALPVVFLGQAYTYRKLNGHPVSA